MNKKTVLWITIGVCLLALIGLLIFIILGIGNTPSDSPTTDPASSALATDAAGATNGATQSSNDTTAPTTESANEPTKTPATEPTKDSGTQPSSKPSTEPTKPSATEPEKTEPTTKPTESQPTQKDDPDETEPPPSTQPSEKDPTLTFPFRVAEYGLVIEKMAPYTGLFVEDGSNTQRTNVAMLLIHNDSGKPLEYAQISITFADDTLDFQLSALPAGERIVVQERTGKQIPTGDPQDAVVLAVQQAEMAMASEISVKDNGDNALTVKNLTDKEIPSVRVFYKYYMEDEGLYVGGIAFTAKITRLSANGSITIRPSHYTSQTSRVVMVRIYDTNE